MTVSTLFAIKKTLIFGFIKLDKVVSKNKALFASNESFFELNNAHPV